MRRDLALVLGIGLLAGLAAADALRDAGGRDASRAPTETATETRAVTLESTPAGFATGVLHGSLVFTDAEDCRVREIGLEGGNERPLPRLAGDCTLWGPPLGPHIAYGLGGGRRDVAPFRFFDLNSPDRNLGGYAALFGLLVWNHDGRRAAWCGRKRTGFDLRLGREARRLPECPAAYTRDDRMVYARGDLVALEGGPTIRAGGAVVAVSSGLDGSFALVVDGERIERHRAAAVETLVIPPARRGAIPVFSPDTCGVLLRRPGGEPAAIELRAFACFPGRPQRRFVGRAAAWSPDGDWVAIAGDTAISFHRVVGRPRTITYPAGAADLHWRP